MYLQIGGISKVIELANTELYLVLSELSYFEDEQSSQFVVRGSHERYHTPNTSKSGSSAPKKVPIESLKNRLDPPKSLKGFIWTFHVPSWK